MDQLGEIKGSRYYLYLHLFLTLVLSWLRAVVLYYHTILFIGLLFFVTNIMKCHFLKNRSKGLSATERQKWHLTSVIIFTPLSALPCCTVLDCFQSYL